MNKQIKKIVSVFIITTFIMASPLGIVANADKDDSKKSHTKENKYKVETRKKAKKARKKEKKQGKQKKQKKQLERYIKNKGKLQKGHVSKSLEQIMKSHKLEEAQGLLKDLKETEIDLKEVKKEMKKIKLEMKRLMKNTYSQKELNLLRKKGEEIAAKNPDAKVIPVENIIKKKGYFKFDTPPVIKEGRTLIPVRAITEGLGANVTWNGEERKVIVSKGDSEIIFQLKDGKVFVNGEEKTIDVPAQIMNNRTIVPLRFIAEELGLKVDYDGETDTIEIDEEEESNEEEGVIEVVDEETTNIA
ncbi:MAG: copper amine oxidase N-terminal domain-containing protein [Anaeromicrobium sp.]|jgi:Ni/Co efflux regulator RcnB|uniref:copper amine oxidase N-terminal domain-containing protein n=1 Tax=Anaeromicrobium sp. TaxID=1929132 RepID=UPI0025EF89F8|nr:copper amine oxidase N-terminal domain-containing protein [Anaeromicrobium sp.]MCT4595714.1 copper amine oxidase N-terminal domain-containing protein [Anaeromicrobium sp.]